MSSDLMGATASILVIGAVIVTALLVAALLGRWRLPALLGYIGLGLALRAIDDAYALLDERGWTVLDFMARAGIIALLFRIGLESKVKSLVSQLRGATLTWASNVAVSGILGFAAARYLLGFELVPGLVTAVALTATSVGIPSAIWRDHDLLDSPAGAQFLDVAELDDISAVILMAMLFAVLPDLRDGSLPLDDLWTVLGWLVLKFIVFAALCLLFALFLEERLTRFLQRIGAPEAPAVIGVAFVIAALAALLGFSEAVGAFLAGLAFSRDPERVEIDASIGPLHDLLTPFFFIGVGAVIPSGVLLAAGGAGLVLAAVATVAKIGGAALPNLRRLGGMGALLVGVSMVPRAEIAMIVMQRAHSLGDWAAPDDLFSAMVLVSLVTSACVTLYLHQMLPRYGRSSIGDAPA